MDIQQWLAATADRAPPERSDDQQTPDAFQAHPPASLVDKEKHVGRSYRRKIRKRASSDSSIIPHRPSEHRRVPAAPRSLPSERARSAESADREPEGSAYSSPLSPGHVPEKSYERRPRHKTRPDRYEPKQRKRERELDAHKERKRSKKRRKSHRSGDGGRTAGLVQSFQLKNVPKNSRLTMKPGANAGLFKHGRASAQVTGRGAGLPDLVFNEMRFLQRPAEHQDEPTIAGDQQQQSKKDRKRPNEGDISAYFNSKKPPHEQHDGRAVPPTDRDGRRGDRRRSPEVDNLRHHVRSVELPPKPFLGFGSEGGQPDVQETHSEHTSYLSWSETPPPKPPEQRRASPPPAQSERPATAIVWERSPPRQGGRDRLSDERGPDSQRRTSIRGQWVQTRRARGPNVIEVCQPLLDAESRQSATKRRSITKTTTSQSLPKGYTADTLHQQPSSDQLRHGYHTSDILRVHEDANIRGPGTETHDGPAYLQTEKENQDPLSSFSVDRLLDKARYITTTTTNAPQHAPEEYNFPRNMLENARTIPTTSVPAPAPPVRGEAIDNISTQQARLSGATRRANTFADRRTLLSSHAAQYSEKSPRMGAYHQRPSAQRHFDVVQPQQRYASADDEMLDNGSELGHEWTLREPVYASIQQAEVLVYGPRLDQSPGIYKLQSEQLQSEATSILRPQKRTPRITVGAPSLSIGRSTSLGRTIRSEQTTVSVAGDVTEALDGFWKPHKLY